MEDKPTITGVAIFYDDLYPNAKERDERKHENKLDLAEQIEDLCQMCGLPCEMIVSDGNKSRIWPTPEEQTEEKQLVIILGGDGCIIDALHYFGTDNNIFLALNFGTLGFMASVHRKSNFMNAVKSALNGSLQLSKKALLRALLFSKKDCIAESLIVNEAVIKGSNDGIIQGEVYIGERFTRPFRGDGIIASTATGSSGYNSSVGGALVAPSLPVIQITGICNIGPPFIPQVVDARDSDVTLKIGDSRGDAHVKFDWGDNIPAEPGFELHISNGPQAIFAEWNEDHFWHTVTRFFNGKRK